VARRPKFPNIHDIIHVDWPMGYQPFRGADGHNGIEPTLVQSSTHNIPATIMI